MSVPTQTQINEEIARIEKIKKSCPRFNRFNEDQHAELDLIVEVLKDSYATTAAEFGELTEEQQVTVLDALRWVVEGGDAPSKGWGGAR